MKNLKDITPYFIKVYLALIAIILCTTSQAQESKSTLITGVRIHTGTGNLIELGAVGFTNGKIDFVGTQNQANPGKYNNVVQYSGEDLYPGLIAANTTLGLNEIFAVRATHDYREVGQFKPNVRSLIAYNAESHIVETVLTNGVMFAQVCPQGGVIKGSSSVMKLKAWNWEDAAYNTDEGICMDWPSMFKRNEAAGLKHTLVSNDKYEENYLKIKSFISEAKAYAQRETPLDIDLKYEAMRGLFDGSKRLYITADYVKEIREIIGFKRDFEIEKITIIGGNDAWMTAELLKENNISIAVRRVHSLPRLDTDAIDASYSLPSKLSQAGVNFCFQMAGSMETSENRNLPFNVGTAIAYGLEYEKAVEAVTLSAAKIMGIDKKTGSIEVGKEANIVISKGDLFDMRTSIVQAMYLNGTSLDLTNRQEDLYLKYKAKYGAENN